MGGFVLKVNEAALKQLLGDPGGPAGELLEKVLVRVQGGAKMLCPVDTGRLRSSITHEKEYQPDGWHGRVGTDVKYGSYVELGTRRMKARPYLRPALGAAQGNAADQQTVGAARAAHRAAGAAARALRAQQGAARRKAALDRRVRRNVARSQRIRRRTQPRRFLP